MLDPRRLAAADMWGTSGSERRRTLIRVEFAVGAIAWWLLLGVWLVGAGLNYVPLAVHAQSLSRPGALEAELDGVDVRAELRRAGAQQFWIAVPGAVALAGL